MANVPDIPIGERVRFYRERRGQTQAATAGLAGISEDYLGQIERGVRTPTIALLHAIARELRVPIAALLGEPDAVNGPPVREGFGAVEQALVGVLPPGGVGDAPGLAELREGVEAAWRTYQSSPTRFSDAAHVLPVLIAAVDAATRAYRSPAEAERREAHRIAADLYALLRSYCKRAGRMSLSLLAADRGLRAAEEADDPVRIAVAQWNLGHHLVADNELDGAEMVVRQAAEALGDWRDSPESAGVYGALQLVRAVTLSRRRDVWGARAVLDGPATQAAKISGECNVGRTVFGPSNLALHRVSVEMEAGEATTALRIADTVNTAGMASIERRVTHLLEVTRCYELHRNDAAVLFHLQKAERLGPEDVHRSLMVRELVRGLRLRARPSFADDIAELAARVGLLAN